MAILEQSLKSLTARSLAPVQLLVIPAQRFLQLQILQLIIRRIIKLYRWLQMLDYSPKSNLIKTSHPTPCSIIPDDLLKLSLRLLHQRILDRRPWATQKRYG
ncbi:hypothetical protein MAN88_35840 [Microcystis aeruginosa]|nr:hypothetical protein MAN88_35840 [Microcystis aeruginosa]